MGKVKGKNGFFVKKYHGKPSKITKNSFATENAKSKSDNAENPTSSGSFFVSPDKKQNILETREVKKNSKLKNKSENESTTSKPKKEFDKKKWRLQKYSKKYKLQQWEEKRKKVVLNEYYKQIKDEPKFDVQKIYEEYGDQESADTDNQSEETDNDNNLNTNTQTEKNDLQTSTHNTMNTVTRKGNKSFKKPHIKYQTIQEEKRQRKEEFQRKKEEKEQALKKYKEDKLEKFKKLNKKTKKGQPIMKYRMEMLLEQIQKSMQ